MEILTAERDLSGRERLLRGALKENKHIQARGKGEIDRTNREKQGSQWGENVRMHEGDKND